jgi:hypothetical protein
MVLFAADCGEQAVEIHGQLPHRRPVEAIARAAAFRLPAHKAGRAQDTQMFRDGRLRERQAAHDLAALTGIVVGEGREDAETNGMAERAQSCSKNFSVARPVAARFGFHRQSTISDESAPGKWRIAALARHRRAAKRLLENAPRNLEDPMQFVAAILTALGIFAATGFDLMAQETRATARIGAGQAAGATARLVEGEGVLLEIALPNGTTQSFPQLGESLVPIDGKPGGAGLIARDLNGDGVDELVIRGSVPPERGAMLVFQWDRAGGEFVPVSFTDDRDRTNKFLVVDAKEPVILQGSGAIEAQFVTTRPDGRKSSHVARYRWSGKGFTQSADN